MTKYDGKIKEPKCSFCGKTSEQVRRTRRFHLQ